MRSFAAFRDVEISTKKKKEVDHANSFDWMIVKLPMYAT